MAAEDANLADRSGNLVESFKGYDPRILLFYAIIALLLITLAGGLGYQQLSKVDQYADRERQQNQRRIVYPGPRGNILDRDGNLLVGNRPRFSVRLFLDQVRAEIRKETYIIRNNYRKIEDRDIPKGDDIAKLARVAVVQRYLDQVNHLLGREEKVDARRLHAHFERELLIPFTLLDDLTPTEYARLVERLPVNSPAQVYTSSTRDYPFKSAASHVLGYVSSSNDVDLENFGEDLRTFKVRGTVGKTGIEQQFDAQLQGEAGGAIFRVDPQGNRINPPLEQVLPKQGKHVHLSLDIDLQLVAETKLAANDPMPGAAIVLDVNTGEVLVLASKPDYDLSKFVPSLPSAVWADVLARRAASARAYQGTYFPGSPFKIVTTLAGLRSGAIPLETAVDCNGAFHLNARASVACNNHRIRGPQTLPMAIENSCNVFYVKYGLDIGPELLAAEARRFHLDRPTGIELPEETRRMRVPDPEWKRASGRGGWVGGDTANMSIGQGDLDVSPLQMACFAASLARDELWTQPTILHRPNRPRQRAEPIGLTPAQRAALLDGMVRVTRTGTGKIFQDRAVGGPLGIDVAGKTGTAQRFTPQGTINIAWMIGFAPAHNPEVAFAVMIEGDTPGEETGGGRFAGPVAHAILKRWLEKKTQPSAAAVKLRTTSR